MNCTFFGHRDAPLNIKPMLRSVLLNLIEKQGVERFYIGNQGNFDAMARGLLEEFEKSHFIRYEIVLAYLPKKQNMLLEMTHTILPEGIETVPPRFAIVYRNKWMIDQSTIIVTYVRSKIGGAAKAKMIAEKQGKTIIELSESIL